MKDKTWKKRGNAVDYHDLYIKMFGSAADAVETLDATINALTALREKLILEQQKAERRVIRADDEPNQAG